MKFEDALKAMREGKKVKNKEWFGGACIRIVSETQEKLLQIIDIKSDCIQRGEK